MGRLVKKKKVDGYVEVEAFKFHHLSKEKWGAAAFSDINCRVGTVKPEERNAHMMMHSVGQNSNFEG